MSGLKKNIIYSLIVVLAAYLVLAYILPYSYILKLVAHIVLSSLLFVCVFLNRSGNNTKQSLSKLIAIITAEIVKSALVFSAMFLPDIVQFVLEFVINVVFTLIVVTFSYNQFSYEKRRFSAKSVIACLSLVFLVSLVAKIALKSLIFNKSGLQLYFEHYEQFGQSMMGFIGSMGNSHISYPGDKTFALFSIVEHAFSVSFFAVLFSKFNK